METDRFYFENLINFKIQNFEKFLNKLIVLIWN